MKNGNGTPIGTRKEPLAHTSVSKEMVEAWEDFVRATEAIGTASNLGGIRIQAADAQSAQNLVSMTQFAMARGSLTEARRHNVAMEALGDRIAAGIEYIASGFENAAAAVQSEPQSRPATAGEKFVDRATGCTDEALEMLGATENALSIAQDQRATLAARVVMLTDLLRESVNSVPDELQKRILAGLVPPPSTDLEPFAEFAAVSE